MRCHDAAVNNCELKVKMESFSLNEMMKYILNNSD